MKSLLIAALACIGVSAGARQRRRTQTDVPKPVAVAFASVKEEKWSSDDVTTYLVTFPSITTASGVSAKSSIMAGLQTRFSISTANATSWAHVDHEFTLPGLQNTVTAELSTSAKAYLQSKGAIVKPLTPMFVSPLDIRVQATQNLNDDFFQNAWGIDRIDQRYLPLDFKYTYNYDGTGVDVYVIDTGLVAAHDEFSPSHIVGGRSFVPGAAPTDWVDNCEGHGTHVAGTIGGSVVGVAKNVTITPLRVFDCSGSAFDAEVIKAIEHAVTQSKARGRRAVINMSLGGDVSAELDTAVTAAVSAGVVVVVAAGNELADACNSSPARAPSAITVMASDDHDTVADFSNWGSCTDVVAPGVDILSAWFDDLCPSPCPAPAQDMYAVVSGTSMACPHVAGVAALVLQQFPSLTPAQVASKIIDASTPGKLSYPPVTPEDGITFDTSPNKLLYSRFAAAVGSASATPTRTPAATKTASKTPSATASQTRTSTATASVSKTVFVTPSTTRTITASPSATRTETRTATPTLSTTRTVTATMSATKTVSATPSVTRTTTVSPTATRTETKSVTSATKTVFATVSATKTVSVTPSVTRSISASPTTTRSESPTPTATRTETKSVTPTASATKTVSATVFATKTVSVTPSVTRTTTVSPTATRSETATPTATRTETKSVTPTSSATKTVSATVSATKTVSVTPSVTRTTTVSPTTTRSETASSSASRTPSRAATPSNSASRGANPNMPAPMARELESETNEQQAKHLRSKV